MVSSVIIKGKNVTKKFTIGNEEIIALNHVNFEFSDHIQIIFGKSGSGKTTLLKILGFLDRPTSGDLWINDQSYSQIPINKLPIIWNYLYGFVLQHSNLIDHFTGEKNIEIPLIFRNMPREERKRRVKEISTVLGINDRLKHRINQLSGGQKQRVVIARELIKQPLVLFADEPTGNLDQETGKNIILLLKRLSKEETVSSMIIATHDLRFEKITNNIHHIEDGVIID